MIADPRTGIWPQKISSPTVAALIRAWGIAIEEESPLCGLEVDPPSATGVLDGIDNEALRVALGVLVCPTRFLVIIERDVNRALTLFTDGAVTVQYQRTGDLHIIGQPMSFATFGAAARELIGVRGGSRSRPVMLAPGMVRLLGGMYEAHESGPPPVSVNDEIFRSLVADTLRGVDPTGLSDALIEDGFMRRSEGGIAIEQAWEETFGVLADPHRFDLLSINLADAHDGFWAPRAISVLGPPGFKCVVRTADGPSQRPAATIRFTPLADEGLSHWLAWLTAGCASPPDVPLKSLIASKRLATLSRSRRGRFGGRWELDTVLELAGQATRGSEAALAVLQPSATLRAVPLHRLRRAEERIVVAMTPDVAVVWTMRGSRVRWQSLGELSRADVLTPLLPETAPAPLRRRELDIAQSAIRGLMFDPFPQRDVGSELEALAARQGAGWYLLRARGCARSDGQPASITVVLTQSRGLWRLEEIDGQMFRAVPVQADSLRGELIDALASHAATAPSPSLA